MANAPSPLVTAKTFGAHLLSLFVPATALAFVATGPHTWYAALPWLAVVPLAVAIDRRSPADRRPPVESMPAWPFDLLLAVLVLVQLANVGLAVALVTRTGLFAVDALVTVLMVGVSSAYSAIVVAHELIHRRSPLAFAAGRLLLVSTLYEHFATEHVRGHHLRVGTDEDPATARFGESFGAFFKRTVPGQLKSAFAIEEKRLALTGLPLLHPRRLGNRVVQGLLIEAALLVALALGLGPAAAVVFAGQAFVAITLLEVVNYFEHWGLRRSGRKVRPMDSWDAESWFTLHALVGLSRHADHHAYAARPYQDLRTWEESPKLPQGYVGMVFLVLLENERAQALLTEELRRKRLGPFAVPEPVSQAA